MIYKGSQIYTDRRSKRSDSSNAVPVRRIRLMGFLGLALVWSTALVYRLYSLQIADHERWQDWALKQHFQEVQLASERGAIYDRDGRLMAVSVPAGSVYLRPKQVQDSAEVVEKLAPLLKIKPSVIKEKLQDSQPFVWVTRQIPRSVAEKVDELALKGVGYVLESRRFYPYNSAAGTLIGKVGIDGNGLSGLEAVFEEQLHKDQLKTKMVRDAFGNMIDVSSKPTEKFKLPKGSELQLTINADIQLIADEELEIGRVAAKAKNAMAVMIDADSGEVLAISQAPAFNLNKNISNPNKDLRNLLIETVFEPGSIFKPLIAAAAIEDGITNPSELIDCEKGNFSFGSHRINDVHPSGIISLSDVIIRSSNVGISKIGIRLGAPRLYEYLKEFGFTERALNLLPGETNGILRPVEKWAKIDVATHSYGQGIAVTPLQILRATAALANGGILPGLRVIEGGSATPPRRVLSENTADKVKKMMYGVVTDAHGTGKNAAIDGILIGGKTGTAQKARTDGRGYMPGAYIASFVGFADASSINVGKNLALIVIMDEPRGKSIYGGTLAAPVFRRIMQRTLHYLTTKPGIPSPKDDSKEVMIVDEFDPQVMQIGYTR